MKCKPYTGRKQNRIELEVTIFRIIDTISILETCEVSIVNKMQWRASHPVSNTRHLPALSCSEVQHQGGCESCALFPVTCFVKAIVIIISLTLVE